MKKNEELKVVRARSGLTQNEMADKLGVSFYCYRKYEIDTAPECISRASKAVQRNYEEIKKKLGIDL